MPYHQSLRGRRTWRAVPWAVAVIAAAGVLAGCEREPAADPFAGQPTTRRAGQPATKPVHVIQGRVLGENGEPIRVPGAHLVVEIAGVSDEALDRVEYYPNPGADGHYRAEVAPGQYSKINGRIEVPFNDKNYRFDLHPVGESTGKRETSPDKPIVQDFVWKLSGRRPRMPDDAGQPLAYYGGSIRLDYRSYDQQTEERLPPAPPGTRLVFTLTPVGKLADGTEGKPLTYERKYDAIGVGVDNDKLVDVPLAMYRLSGEEVYLNKTRRPLLILDRDEKGPKWNTFTTGTFEPDLEKNRTHPVSVRFKRQP